MMQAVLRVECVGVEERVHAILCVVTLKPVLGAQHREHAGHRKLVHNLDAKLGLSLLHVK